MDSLEKILERLERDSRLRAKVTNKLTRMYKRHARFSMVGEDIHHARVRDLNLRFYKGNLRADLIVLFAILGLIAMVGLLIYFRDTLNSDITFIFANVITFFSSILNDASLFEFGNNALRVHGRR